MVNQAEFSLKKHSIGVGDRFGYQGAALLKEIYAQAYEQRDDLMAPYREVLDINVGKLPLPEEIAGWPGQALADSITHRQAEPLYIGMRSNSTSLETGGHPGQCTGCQFCYAFFRRYRGRMGTDYGH